MKIFDFLAEEMKIEAELYPMADFLDSLANRMDFVKYVDGLTKGQGLGLDGVMACAFPEDQDEYEISRGMGFENGVRFTVFGDKTVVEIQTFWKYLRTVCEVYWVEHPETEAILKKYLARPKPSLELPPEVTEWMGKWKRGEYSQIAKAT